MEASPSKPLSLGRRVQGNRTRQVAFVTVNAVLILREMKVEVRAITLDLSSRPVQIATGIEAA